jgi:hypothetical protein
MGEIELLTEILKLFNSLRAEDSSLRADIDHLKGEFMALKDQQALLTTKVEALTTALASETTELKTAFDALMARIADLEGIDLTPQINAVEAAILGVSALSELSVTPAPDAEIPTTPSSLTASNITSSSADLSWGASTDNAGVTGYEVFSGADKVGDATGTTFTASGLTPATNYVFSVRAKDANGNFSVMSDPVTVDTTA